MTDEMTYEMSFTDQVGEWRAVLDSMMKRETHPYRVQKLTEIREALKGLRSPGETDRTLSLLDEAEPVAWDVRDARSGKLHYSIHSETHDAERRLEYALGSDLYTVTPLYTSPTPRERTHSPEDLPPNAIRPASVWADGTAREWWVDDGDGPRVVTAEGMPSPLSTECGDTFLGEDDTP